MTYRLYIGNKNYSSWSLRPWVAMRELGIAFTEQLIPFGSTAEWDALRRISPNGKVPCLIDGECVVWDSLAILEYLAERHAAIWPAERTARAFARSAAAEMHSGFAELRRLCSMSCGQRVRLHEFPPGLERDIARIDALWNQGLRSFGGPFLAGEKFTGVDAFFAPVVFRIQSYGLTPGPAALAYAKRMLELPSMREWYAGALREKFRDLPHEEEIRKVGTVLEDLRES